MAWSSACRIYSQNLLVGSKDKLAGNASSKGNNTSAVLRAFISAIFLAPPVISALFSIAQYLKDDFQQILRTVLDFQLPVSPSAPIPASW